MKKAFYFFILNCIVSAATFAQWNPDKSQNNALNSGPYSQVQHKVCKLGQGRFLVAWWDDHTTGVYSLWVQKFDSLGNNFWGVHEVQIYYGSTVYGDMNLAPDGTGGAIVAFTLGSGPNANIWAQRVNGNGILEWNGGAPLNVCSADSAQYNVKIVSHTDGSSIIVWQDERAGLNKDDIYAQKLNSAGTALWTVNGVVVNAALNAQEIPEAISDSLGGAIVTWRDSRSGTNFDVYAQHINSTGVRQWVGTDGLLSGRAISTAVANQNIPRICTDGAGGAIICWQDFRDGGTNSTDIYAQRVDNSGVVQWMADGVVLCNTTNTQDIRDLTFVGDGAVVVWTDYLPGGGGTARDLKTQKINAAGNVVWTTNGVVVCNETGDQDQCRITTDNNQGAIFVWTDGRLADEGMDIYAQRINSAGSPLWTTNGNLVSNGFIDQYNPYVISNGCNSIFVWTDMRNGLTDQDLYGSSFDCNGNVLGSGDYCDGIDNDNDGLVDEDATQLPWYQDLDNDGFGNAAVTQLNCSQPSGYVTDNADCNDGDDTIHPNAAEVCNGIDDDCDGLIDENVQNVFYRDQDGDTYGNNGDTVHRCSLPAGYVSNNTDCNDSDASVHPGVTETCNGLDDNCDGVTDEGCNTLPSITINDVTVSEADGQAVLGVQLSSVAAQEVKVNYSTTDGTATTKGKVKDYKMTKGTLTIPPGEISGVITVIINTDNIDDDNEFFDVLLNRPVNATITDERGRVTILNAAAARTGSRITDKPVSVLSALEVKLLPNPSRNHFTLTITSASHEPVSINVIDALGRNVEKLSKIKTNDTVTLGAQYGQGLYYAEVIQGSSRIVLKLLKISE